MTRRSTPVPREQNLTPKEIVTAISLGMGVSLREAWLSCFEDLPVLHRFFSPSLLVTVEMLLGRIEDIQNQMFPGYTMLSNNGGGWYLAEPQDMSARINLATVSILRRMERYVRIGLQRHPEVTMWLDLGSAIGRHVTSLDDADRTNLESQYQQIYQAHFDPAPCLEQFVQNFEGHTFLAESRTESIQRLRQLAEQLRTTDPERGTEKSILTAARLKFPELTDKDILVIRSLISLGQANHKDRFKGKKILTHLLENHRDKTPTSWNFPKFSEEPSSSFKGQLAQMSHRKILESHKKLGYRLGHWSGLKR